jgi:thiamine-phosphate pyrophosphorylase
MLPSDLLKSVLPVLCWVTRSTTLGGKNPLVLAREVISNGVDMVQVRDKNVSRKCLKKFVLDIKSIANDRIILTVNGNIQIAQETDIDGVHFPEIEYSHNQDDLKGIIIGQSAHSIDSAIKSESMGCDYIIAGTIYPSKTHPDGEVSGLKLIEQIKKHLSIPVIAIGGINESNIVDVMNSGADGIAVIGAISESVNPSKITRDLKTLINKNYRK